MNSVKISLALLIILGTIFTASGQVNTAKPSTPSSETDETKLTFYGFGRTNFIWDDQELGRSDLFVPANIRVGDGPRNSSFFIGAKQTRLGIDLKHSVGGEDIILKFEGDFHNDASDATGIFRMRHAYAKYRFVLVGMTWSNFFDIDANASSVDFEGPMSSTLSRTPQIRFATYKTKNVLSLSFENPIEKITSTVDSISALPERFPDVIGAYRVNGKFGFVKVAALVRELRYQSDEARSLLGYGITVMGAIKAGDRDKLRFQGVMGTGVAKYIEGSAGLNYDAINNGTNELEALQMKGASISYQHFWKEHMHSSITGGYLDVEENENLEANNYQSGYYGSVNLFWNVLSQLTFGAEALVGQRVNVNDDSGTGVRVEMSATYKFNKPIK
jgi:hypothetical protein